MRSKKAIEKEIGILRGRLSALDKELNESNSRTYVVCEDNCYGKGCGKRTQIRKLTYIRTHWYSNEPYNEDWREGDGQFDCPHCGHRNRLYNRAEVKKLKYNFGRIVESFDERWRPLVEDKWGYTPPCETRDKVHDLMDMWQRNYGR